MLGKADGADTSTMDAAGASGTAGIAAANDCVVTGAATAAAAFLLIAEMLKFLPCPKRLSGTLKDRQEKREIFHHFSKFHKFIESHLLLILTCLSILFLTPYFVEISTSVSLTHFVRGCIVYLKRMLIYAYCECQFDAPVKTNTFGKN